MTLQHMELIAWKGVLKTAFYENKEADKVKSEYAILKERLVDLLYNRESSSAHIFKQFEDILYKTHTCTEKCDSSVSSKCQHFMKILEPRKIISMKVLHLLLKFLQLYNDIGGVLHLFLRCASKTHAESVAESMGNCIDIYSDKKRGLDITTVGQETYIKWNGPPVYHAEEIGKEALDIHFNGRSNWKFVSKSGRTESIFVSRL